MPSGPVQSGKGLQSKSQFRTIAPKIVPKVLTSRVLSGQSPSLSDLGNPGPSVSATPLGVPTQNYALMQVAGQKGTFSLVALSHVASAQPVQKPRLRLPENLKLPIPRYQPPRNSKGWKKSSALSSSESSGSRPLGQTQASPTLPDQLEALPQPSPTAPVPPLAHAPASIGVAALTDGSSHRGSQPLVPNDHGDPNLPDTPASSVPEEPPAGGLVGISGEENLASKETSGKSAAAGEIHKGQVHLAKGTARSSPDTLGNALQVTPSVPKGELPVLPRSRMKTTQVYKSEPDVGIADFPLPGLGEGCARTSAVTEGFDAATAAAERVPGPQTAKQGPCKSAFCPATKLDRNQKTKLNGGAVKRKGRKRKGSDEILSLQGKRKKCKRIKNDPQQLTDGKPGAVKKYRSIMPKPAALMPAVAALAPPAALLHSQRPVRLGQGVWFNGPLTPGPKPSSAVRGGFSGAKKPWHGCPFCNHHFQFKQHLRDHMNTHTNRRPYSCRVCRKAYVRSGSLSAHMKLQHGESRPRKLVCCEFCAKVFGHVRIYFGHLKEVHRVVISTEPAPSELQPGDPPKSRDGGGNVPRESKSSLEEDLLLNQADEVKLQIKCGRCQITAKSFAEIKFHLLNVHGEEIQGRLQGETSPGSWAAREDLVQLAAPSCRQRPERRRLLKRCPSNEEARAFPKPERQLYLHPQSNVEILRKNEGARLGPSRPGEVPQGPARPSPHSALPQSPSGFNCILCTQTLGRQEELLLHWEQGHSCEDPGKLWGILSALSTQGLVALQQQS